ncbi:hypothetical protein Pcinc_043529 [Petrolisthes cinctipes]|uniref:Uncharacterized protein n=1 Tax=Petrolisthes cinctipes TaxID=88211 RepID=A0AAE1EG10_PETCI|nr:hypothetical protein Pcinc_043529 [Petrolisthes cinctipes]
MDGCDIVGVQAREGLVPGSCRGENEAWGGREKRLKASPFTSSVVFPRVFFKQGFIDRFKQLLDCVSPFYVGLAVPKESSAPTYSNPLEV